MSQVSDAPFFSKPYESGALTN
ncbi:protein of unknown function [Methanoculleus bourgensis]|uniref:Uncharacterized protein n=1 Tax=Methanoculleus bourgensis TaxID=83986 RepID=A0A0X3BNZ8_9EURY|nr:protein of unknown function [Methanoculleus bourgensis]